MSVSVTLINPNNYGITISNKLLKTLAATMIASALISTVFADNILIVMSDEDHLDLKGTDVYPTGFYLNELMQPVKMFLDAGHDVTFATPNGGAPSLDKVSENVMLFGSEAALVEHKNLLVEMQITNPSQSTNHLI